MELIQIALVIIQLSALEGYISSGEKRTKIQDKGTAMDLSGEDEMNSGQLHGTKQPFGDNRLRKGAFYQPTNAAPIKKLVAATNPMTVKYEGLSKFATSESEMVVKRKTVPGESTTGTPTKEHRHKSIVKRSVIRVPKRGDWIRNTTHDGKRAVMKNKRRIRSSVKSRRRIQRERRRRRRSTTARPTFILPTTKTSENSSNVTDLPKKHPCNSNVKSSIMKYKVKYKVKDIECRRWRTSELEQKLNCLGKFNHQYFAASWREALKFRDLDTGDNLDFSKSFVWKGSSRLRIKRDANQRDIDPGETLFVKCYAAKTPTETGHLRICPICTTVTRQPSNPKRFPEYINELVCDPNSTSNYIAGIDGFCVQKTLTMDLLQFNGDWEINSALSEKEGHDIYTEKWEPYTQTIKRHCACELLPSSPIMTLL